MLRTSYTRLTRGAIARRTFATQTAPPSNGSNGLALAAAGALGIGGYMYYKSANDDKNHTRNPMVNEKVTADKTKSSREVELENKAKNDTSDTTNLVGKDTDKVKNVWDDKDKDKDDQPKSKPLSSSSSSSSSEGSSGSTSSSNKTEDNTHKVEKDSDDANKHWQTKDKIDDARFNSDKDSKKQAEAKVNQFRKDSTDNLHTLKEKAGEQVEHAKEWAQDGVNGIQENLHQAQEKVSQVFSKDK